MIQASGYIRQRTCRDRWEKVTHLGIQSSPFSVDVGLLDREVESVPVSKLLTPISAKGPCRLRPGDIAESLRFEFFRGGEMDANS